ncbi:MAG: hypothetical protein V4515_12195 [Chloroflexota bacterium]
MKRLALALAFALGYAAGRTDAATPRSASEPVPPAVFQSLTGAPLGAPTPTAAAQPSAPAVSVSGTPDPGTTAPPSETWMREGTIWWADASHGSAYLAIPIGPGHLVDICGPAGCLTLVSTDAGPSLERQRAGRIADLAVELWEQISGVDRRFGGTPGTWTLVP